MLSEHVLPPQSGDIFFCFVSWHKKCPGWDGEKRGLGDAQQWVPAAAEEGGPTVVTTGCTTPSQRSGLPSVSCLSFLLLLHLLSSSSWMKKEKDLEILYVDIKMFYVHP